MNPEFASTAVIPNLVPFLLAHVFPSEPSA